MNWLSLFYFKNVRIVKQTQNCEGKKSHNCEIKTQLQDINSELWENVRIMRSQLRKSQLPYLTFSSEMQDVISEKNLNCEKSLNSEFISHSSEERDINSELWKKQIVRKKVAITFFIFYFMVGYKLP